MASLNLFISYRREDSPRNAERFFNRLTDELGRNHVFRDVDSIRPGQNFLDAIREKLDASNVLLAVIGPRWLTATDQDGRMCLSDANDPVRAELEMGLKLEMRLIPVLLAGATMPSVQELPETLAPIARFHTQEIRDTHFDQDVLDLIAEARTRPRFDISGWLRGNPISLGAAGLVIALVVVTFLFQAGVFRRRSGPNSSPNAANDVSGSIGGKASTGGSAEPKQTARNEWELKAEAGPVGKLDQFLAFSPNRGQIATWGAESPVRIVETGTGGEVLRLADLHDVNDAVFTPDGSRLAIATGFENEDGDVRIVEVATGKEILNFPHQSNGVNTVTVSGDGKLLAAASGPRLLVAGTAETAKPVWRPFSGYVGALAFSPDRRRLAIGSWNKTARVMRISGNKQTALITHEQPVNAVAFSSDGKWVAAASGQLNDSSGKGRVTVMDAANGKEILRGGHANFFHVSFSPDNKWVAAWGLYAAVVCEVASGQETVTLPENGLLGVAFSPDSAQIAVAASDGVVVMDDATGKELAHFANDNVRGVAFISDGRLVAASTHGVWVLSLLRPTE
jgi:WD40 repeat protein